MMLKPRNARTGGLAVRILGSLAVLVGLGAIMVLTLPREDPDNAGKVIKNPGQDSNTRRCESQLADIIEGLTPGRLGISSDRGSLIDRLNSWHEDCGKLTGDTRPSSDNELIESLLSGEALTRTLSDRYLAEDASHVRMSLLARDIVTNVVEGNTSNVDRAVSLFNFMSRNVILINDEIRQTMPMTPYESLVFGLGTAEDRAWIYSELLRQTRTDVVILTPRQEEHAEHWLLGVIDAQQGILLFDPRLGLPIPAEGSPTDTPFPRIPATLAQVQASDAAFRQLDVPNSPYPLTSADMQELDVSLIGSSSSWSPRMALLQYLLPQGVNVDLYNGLGDNELRAPGALNRIEEAGKNELWSKENVSIWKYPETQEDLFEATRGEGEKESQLANFNFIFKGPYVPRPTDEEGKKLELTPIAKSLHFVRVEQLKGNLSDAIRDYLPIRTTVKLVPNPANQMASEFGTLWTGVSQYETQKIRTAVGTLDRYVRMQPRSAGMVRSAIEFLSDCLLTQKNYVGAAQILQQAPTGFAPRRDQYLFRRWLRIGGIDPDQLPKTPAISIGAADEVPARAPSTPPQPAPQEKSSEEKPVEAPAISVGPADEAPASAPATPPGSASKDKESPESSPQTETSTDSPEELKPESLPASSESSETSEPAPQPK